MSTIDTVDFSKLKPFDGKTSKCFEQLWYQIAKKAFGHLGVFTSIDGSGGDGGIEFYLTLENGETWGWQCRLFSGSGRLSESNRQQKLKSSLETACRNYPTLSKWFLCLKTDLTSDSIAANGKTKKGEISWLNDGLKSVVPNGRTIEIIPQGPSELLLLLRDPRHNGILKFFFGQIEFSPKWFEEKFHENFAKAKNKYDSDLHTIDDFHQSLIDFTLQHPRYITTLSTFKDGLVARELEIKKALRRLERTSAPEKEKYHKDTLVNQIRNVCQHFQRVFESIDKIIDSFRSFSRVDVDTFDVNELNDDFQKSYDEIETNVFDRESYLYRDVSSIIRSVASFAEEYHRFFDNYFHDFHSELHFTGGAAKGKTHLVSDIAYQAIKLGQPVIFITGDKFSDESTIKGTFLKLLDLGPRFTFDDFIEALNVYGEIVRVRVPIIIDGLNETTSARLFSEIWKKHLPGFVTTVKSQQNVVLITTVRTSYIPRIWGNQRPPIVQLDGFSGYSTILEAVKKYFSKYRLRSHFVFSSVQRFKDPILLKIFCELKSPGFGGTTYRDVNLEDESIYDVLLQYSHQVNTRITNDNPKFRIGEDFVLESLTKLAKYMWKDGSREISTLKYYELIDGTAEYNKDLSKSDILIHEGLMFTKDLRGQGEFVTFTYDRLAGYMISRSLITDNADLSYFVSDEFVGKMNGNGKQHPLFEDVLSALCLLLPQLKGLSLHEIISSDQKNRIKKSPAITEQRTKYYNTASNTSVNSLFKLSGRFIRDADVKLIKKLFEKSDAAKNNFYRMAIKSVDNTLHPFNADLLHELLFTMPVALRDISWSEFVRKNYRDMQTFLSYFEMDCRENLSEIQNTRRKGELIAKFVMWLLTSTNRGLRDRATRALYYYGRRFPADFARLTYQSLSVNDPYVWERTIAALYGVVMAEHNSFRSTDFRENVLPEIGRTLYELIFKKGAPHSTTHILARGFAVRIIEFALRLEPTLLNNAERKNIESPFKFGGMRKWGEVKYTEAHGYSGPIQMDFSNYTLGSLVKNGDSYADPPEKKRVRRQIYWRIENLGWNKNLFSEIEKSVTNDDYYSRGERPKVERYGKKYSWIAYFENAGLRQDLGCLPRDHRYRISSVDIDPSFPEPRENTLYVKDNLLGQDEDSLMDWLDNGGSPNINDFLISNWQIDGNDEWVCMDGFVVQQSLEIERRRFTFIRPFLISNTQYRETLRLLKKHKFGGRKIPDKHQNHYSFAGELFAVNNATYPNYTYFRFIDGKEKVTVRPGQYEYYALYYEMKQNGEIAENAPYPNEIEGEVFIDKERKVLMPAMEYNWENYHSDINQAGPTTVLAREIAFHLKLIDQPQTFDLFDAHGKLAVTSRHFEQDFNNNHEFLYLRKDLLEQYLRDKKMKFVWAIWGEREPAFEDDARRTQFYEEYPYKGPHHFQNIVEYPL